MKICPACQAANPPKHRHCSQCGAGLGTGCSACGFDNPASARFCGGCGARVGQTVAPSAAAATAGSAPIAQRRDVTILFADLTNFTQLSTELDAEELHAIVKTYTAQVETTVLAFGGIVERYLGDAVMAIFGAPVAHGDDGLRAVRTAIAIQEQVMPALSLEFGRLQQAAIGIASGEVLSITGQAGHPAGFAVVGEAVNLASRVESLARGGEILISESVHEATRGRIRCELLGEQSLKGIPRRVRIHRVLGVDDAGESLRRTPLVGRDSEIARLQNAVTRCAVDGVGGTVYLRGDPGIGKTRLLEHFAAMARSGGMAVHSAAYLDFGLEQSLSGVPAVLASLLGVAASASPELRRAALAQQVGWMVAEDQAFAADALRLTQDAATRAVLDAMDAAGRAAAMRGFLRRFLAHCVQQQRFMVAIEDVHWAKPSDIDQLHALIEIAAQTSFIVALTSRLEGDTVSERWADKAGELSVEVVDLRPLSIDAAQLLASGFQPGSNAVLDSCVARAEGNPLFLEQLLRHVAETGSREVPGTVRNVVLARLDRLAAPDHRAALTASVIGQRFGLRLLRRMLRDDHYNPAGLMESGLVRVVGEDFLFAHALVHEGAYASLLHSTARELHRDAAEYFAPLDRLLRAQHLDRAGDDRAAMAFREAAAAEAEAFRFTRALELVARGLQLCTRPAERVDLRLLEGRTLHDAGEIQASMQAFRAALAEGGDETQQCRAWIGLAAVMRVSDDLDGAFDALRRAEPMAQSRSLWLELAELHYLRGSLHFPRGELDDCLASHGHALELARRAGSAYEEARAMSGLGDAHYANGRIRTAYRYFTDCIDLCREHGFGRIEASNLFMVATVRVYLNELDQALQDALRSIDIAHRVGHQRAEIVARLIAAWIYLMQARPDAAELHTDAGLLVADKLGARRFRAFLLESVARIRLARGERAGAQAAIHQALEIARALEVMRFIGPWLLGTAALTSTDAYQSQAALTEGAALLDAGCIGHNYYWFYKHAMESCLEHGDASGVGRYADQLEAYTAAEPTPWSDLFIRRARVLIAPDDAASQAERRAVLQLAREVGQAQAQERLEAASRSA